MKNLKSIKIKIFYDENLKKITGKDFEEAVVSENLNFAMFLNFIFSSYPIIPKRFIPGTLGLLLNGIVPKEEDILKDGDKLEISVMKIEDTRREIENQVRAIIDYYKVDITFEKIKEMVFIENDQKDFNNLIEVFAGKIANLDELNAVLQVINAIWNYFPHKSLNGLCPTEKISESQQKNKNKSSATRSTGGKKKIEKM
jgi:hypothetical protein